MFNPHDSWQKIHKPSDFISFFKEKEKGVWLNLSDFWPEIVTKKKKKRKFPPKVSSIASSRTGCCLQDLRTWWLVLTRVNTEAREPVTKKASGLSSWQEPSEAQRLAPAIPWDACLGDNANTCVSLLVSFPCVWLLGKVRVFPGSGLIIQETTPLKHLTQCF